MLGLVLCDDGLNLLAVVSNVFFNDLPQLGTFGLILGFQGLDILCDSGTEVSGGVRDGGDDVVSDGRDSLLQFLDLSVQLVNALS